MRRLFTLIGLLAVLCSTSSCLSILLSGSEDNESTTESITMYDEPGDILPYKTLEIYRVFEDGAALAHASEGDKVYSFDPSVYLIGDAKSGYYDKQIIKLTSSQCVRQMGIYRQYSSTYPVVQIINR